MGSTLNNSVTVSWLREPERERERERRDTEREREKDKEKGDRTQKTEEGDREGYWCRRRGRNGKEACSKL